ncbi:hypothetical protein V6N13_084144 [Hibiscus sabdariffa]
MKQLKKTPADTAAAIGDCVPRQYLDHPTDYRTPWHYVRAINSSISTQTTGPNPQESATNPAIGHPAAAIRRRIFNGNKCSNLCQSQFPLPSAIDATDTQPRE